MRQMRVLKNLYLLWKNRHFMRQVSEWMDVGRMDRALTMETVLTDRQRQGMQELNMINAVLRNDPRLVSSSMGELRLRFKELKNIEAQEQQRKNV